MPEVRPKSQRQLLYHSAQNFPVEKAQYSKFVLSGDYILNEDIRNKVLELVKSGEYSWAEITRNLGWDDSQRLKRRLGITANVTCKPRKVYSSYSKYISYDLALRIVVACNLDPIDVGL